MKVGNKYAVKLNDVTWWPIVISLATAAVWFFGYLMSITHFSEFGIDVSKFAVFTDYFTFLTVNFILSLSSFFVLWVITAFISLLGLLGKDFVFVMNTNRKIKITEILIAPVIVIGTVFILIFILTKTISVAAIGIKQGYTERYNIINHNSRANCVAIIGNAGPYTAIWDYKTKVARLIKTDDISIIEYAVGTKYIPKKQGLTLPLSGSGRARPVPPLLINNWKLEFENNCPNLDYEKELE